MIKTIEGRVIILGDAGELLSDIACIIGTISLKTEIPKELIKESFEDGFKLSEILKNGGDIEDFFKETEERKND